MRRAALTAALACTAAAAAATVAVATPATAAAPTNATGPSFSGARILGEPAKQMLGVFVVPQVACDTQAGPAADSSVELGTYIASSDEVSEASAAGVNIRCVQNGTHFVAEYQPYTYHGVDELDYTDKIAPGDTVVLIVSATGKGRTAFIGDLKRGWSESWNVGGTAKTDETLGGKFGLIAHTDMTPYPDKPLANVGTVYFPSAVASGVPIRSLKPVNGQPRVVLQDMKPASTTLADASWLNLNPLGGFKVTWHAGS